MWPMLDRCIVTLTGAGLKASKQFPPLRGVYQRGTCKGCYKNRQFSLLIMVGGPEIIEYTPRCHQSLSGVNMMVQIDT